MWLLGVGFQFDCWIWRGSKDNSGAVDFSGFRGVGFCENSYGFMI